VREYGRLDPSDSLASCLGLRFTAQYVR